jgi:hypothetical protein
VEVAVFARQTRRRRLGHVSVDDDDSTDRLEQEQLWLVWKTAENTNFLKLRGVADNVSRAKAAGCASLIQRDDVS